MRFRESPTGSRESAGRVVFDINVTPLVDVCLVLLIIFMVVTPLINEGVDVALPETPAPASLPDDREAIVIAVKADGRVFVGSVEVTLDQLVERVRGESAGVPAPSILLRGDRSLPYATVREVMKRLADGGLHRAALATVRHT